MPVYVQSVELRRFIYQQHPAEMKYVQIVTAKWYEKGLHICIIQKI